LIPKPKGFKGKFDCPTIITQNPEELDSVPQQFPHDFYDYLNDPKYQMAESHAQIEEEQDIKIQEISDEEPA